MLLVFILIILLVGVYSCMSHLYTRQVFAIISENGTCTDGIHKVPDKILDNNGINGSFNRLTSDNGELAEIVCQNLLNGNATINIAPFNYSNVMVNQSSR